MSEESRIIKQIKRLAAKSSALLERQDYDNSILISQKALTLAISHYGEIDSNVGSLYCYLGSCYSNKEEFDKALEYLFKSMNIFLALKGKHDLDLASVYNNIATAFWRKTNDLYNKDHKDKNDINSSIIFFKKSLRIYLKSLGADNEYVALLYNNLGYIYNDHGRKKAALNYFRLSNKIFLKLFGVNSFKAASSYLNIGIYFYNNSNYKNSIKYFKRSLSILIDLNGSEIYISQRYRMLALAYLNLKQYSKALHLIERSIFFYLKHSHLTINEVIEFSPNIKFLNILRVKADILKSSFIHNRSNLKDLKSANDSYKSLINLLYNIRKDYFNDNSKNILSLKSVSIFENAISVCRELYRVSNDKKYIDEAYKYSQKSKSLSLIENIRDYDAKISSKIPVSILKKEKDLMKKISDYEKQLYDENKRRDASEARIIDLRNKLFDLKQKFEALIKRLETDYTEYYSLKYDLKTITADDIRKQLPEDTMIIEYFFGDKNIFAFVFTTGDCFVNCIKKSKSFSVKILKYRDLLTQISNNLSEDSINKFNNLSYYLFKILLKDILPFRRNSKVNCFIKTILIIPDNELSIIPFDTLLTDNCKSSYVYKDLPYLIKYFNIIYSYSIILYLKNLYEADRNRKLNILAFAPDFISQNDQHKDDPASAFRNSLSPLNFNQKEVKEISKHFTGNFYFNKEAIKEKFTKNEKKFSILHFATHSVMDDQNPMYSKIVFSKSKKKEDDGFLHTYEIHSINAEYDLVVLSACNTGSGRMIRGEGIMSIARAFAATGSKNIVMTLWHVNDKSTMEIMKSFYVNLSKGEKVGEALRQAKLKYIKKSNRLSAHPFYWSPFISFGVNNTLN